MGKHIGRLHKAYICTPFASCCALLCCCLAGQVLGAVLHGCVWQRSGLALQSGVLHRAMPGRPVRHGDKCVRHDVVCNSGRLVCRLLDAGQPFRVASNFQARRLGVQLGGK